MTRYSENARGRSLRAALKRQGYLLGTPFQERLIMPSVWFFFKNAWRWFLGIQPDSVT
jgi:hypothetical protein